MYVIALNDVHILQYPSLLLLLPRLVQFSSIFSTADVTEVTAVFMSCSLVSATLACSVAACTK